MADVQPTAYRWRRQLGCWCSHNEEEAWPHVLRGCAYCCSPYAIEWLMSNQLLTGGEGNSAAGAATTKKRHGRTFCVDVHIAAVRTPLNG